MTLAAHPRDHRSPYSFVIYEGEGWTHAHMVPVFGVLGLEEAATLLADAVQACSDTRHDGHGRNHSVEDANKAFSEAYRQLTTWDYQNIWDELQRMKRRYFKWNGKLTGGRPVPEAIVMPDKHPEKWELLVNDREGNPFKYKIRAEFADMLNDTLKVPSDLEVAEYGFRSKE